jgi:hypothetical protein
MEMFCDSQNLLQVFPQGMVIALSLGFAQRLTHQVFYQDGFFPM